MIKKFQKIESENRVEEIEYCGERVWSYLRISYFYESIKKSTEEYEKTYKKSAYSLFFNMIKESIYGFRNWFKGFDYFVFSDTGERYKDGGFYIDKSTGKIIDILGKDNCIFIETPSPNHLPKSCIDTKHVVSISGINLIISLLTILFYKLNIKKVSDIHILDSINKSYMVNINYKKEILRFNVSKSIWFTIFKIYKPKAIFINCYYGKQYIIKAANKLNIKTIEVQHGTIVEKNFFYNPLKKLDTSYFPNIILTYGDFEKKIIEKNINNPFLKVIPIGNYFLEYIQNKPISINLIEIINSYKYSISISTQYPVEKKLAKFIQEISIKYRNIAFLFSLRHFDKSFYKQFKFLENVYLFKGEYSCYDIMKTCDIHMSVYSTCGLEALFFNKKVILVNIDNLAKEYMAEVKNNNLYIVENFEEFEVALNREFKEDIENILYKKNYYRNINNFIENNLYKT